MSIVDSLRKLSLKLTGAYSTGEDIEDNIEYIAENYSGGGSGGVPIFTAIGTFDDAAEHWDYVLADDSSVESIIEHATAGDLMFLRAIHKYNTGEEEVIGVYPLAYVYKDYSEPEYPVVTSVEFGTTKLEQIGQGVSPDIIVNYVVYMVDSDGTVYWDDIEKSLTE